MDGAATSLFFHTGLLRLGKVLPVGRSVGVGASIPPASLKVPDQRKDYLDKATIHTSEASLSRSAWVDCYL